MEGFSAFAVATILVWSNRYATAGVRKFARLLAAIYSFYNKMAVFDASLAQRLAIVDR
jgi:hypothetical protein